MGALSNRREVEPNVFIRRHRERVRTMLALMDDPDTLDGLTDAVADRIAPLLMSALVERLALIAHDKWLDSREAADYLAISLDTLHRLTSARDIPFVQDQAGGRLYFRRAELDQWRETSVSREFPGARDSR
jgi:excisionase family DNA binding protein